MTLDPFIRAASGLGVGERFVRLAAWGLVALAALLFIAAAWGAFRIVDWFDDRAAVEKAVTKANLEDLKQQADADRKAADERLSDERSLSDRERNYRDAIDDVPGPPARPSVHAVALGCERLRAAGYNEAGLPAECRHAGGDRAETAPDASHRYR